MSGNRRRGTSSKPLDFHRDHLGSVIAITDDNEREVGTYEYFPFGELSTSAKDLGNFVFTGQEIDWDINLYHFPARYYEPQWGRFVTSDPYTYLPDDARQLSHISFIARNAVFYKNIAAIRIQKRVENILQSYSPQILNRYSYTANNPANLVDPMVFTMTGIPLSPICKRCRQCHIRANKFMEDWMQLCNDELSDCLKQNTECPPLGESRIPPYVGVLNCYSEYIRCYYGAASYGLLAHRSCDLSVNCIACYLEQADIGQFLPFLF